MKTAIKSVAVMAVILLLAVPANATKPDKTAIPPVPKDQAQIVFLRHSIVSARETTLLYDTTSGQPKVIAVMNNNRKFVLNVPPGEHVFMVGNLPLCDFLQATVLPDKRYHVVIVPHWPESFTMRPVRHTDGILYTSEEFHDLLKYTTHVGGVPESVKEDALKQAESDYKPKWEQWQAKTPDQKAILTLRAEDSET